MKLFRIFTLTLLAVLAVSAFSGMAVAQNTIQVTFQLDEQLHWGVAVLPPGAYTMTIDSLQPPVSAVIRSDDRKIAVLASANITGDPVSQKSFIQLAGTGANRRVLSLNLPQMGVDLIYSQLTRAEKEEMAKQTYSGVEVAVR